MIAIVDYGVGNLFSLTASLKYLGQNACVTGDPKKLLLAQKVILPGVGAFGDAAAKLKVGGLFSFIKELAASGVPLLGICLGMQLLFSESCEYGQHEGLGLIPGKIVPLPQDSGLKVPQMGWNSLNIKKDDVLLKDVAAGDSVYFVHSYYASGCEPYVLADVDYGLPVTALVRNKNVCGAQFHPEKSGAVGLSILKAFCEEE